jgi:hypothetical protein
MQTANLESRVQAEVHSDLVCGITFAFLHDYRLRDDEFLHGMKAID